MELTTQALTIETTYVMMAIAALGATALVVAVDAIIPRRNSADERVEHSRGGKHTPPGTSDTDN